MKRCRARGCLRRPHPASYYGRCTEHMWCEHCGIEEVVSGRLGSACREYARTHAGALPPPHLIELRRRRQA